MYDEQTISILVGLIFVALVMVSVIFIIRKKGIKLPIVPSLPKIRSKEYKIEDEELEKVRIVPHKSDTELLEEKAEILKERVLQEKERAKKLEEIYDELRVEFEKTKDELKRKDEEIKKKEEVTQTIEEESKKLARFIAKRYKKGQYIPVVLWTKRGNPMPYKFVVEIGWVNGGWRALLVDSITARPETGQWFPPLDKPAPNFKFRDDPGFNPDDPHHSVLFDISARDWEEDLKVSRADPYAKPVAFSFGIDEEGNPIHKLDYGAPVHINTLRAENRNLKRQLMRYMHVSRETEYKLRDVEYQLQMEKDLRQHLEKELKLLRTQLYETKDITMLMGDELEAAREAFRSQKLRRMAAHRRAEEAEKLFDAYYARPAISELPGAEYLEHQSKDKTQKLYSMLAPIARVEAKMYDIDTTGKDDKDIVNEWLNEKYKKENKTLGDVLREYGLDIDAVSILKGVGV